MSMIHLLIIAVHLLATTIAKLMRPGGVCVVVAESLLIKHQLLISTALDAMRGLLEDMSRQSGEH
jgi:hypothetical protein